MLLDGIRGGLVDGLFDSGDGDAPNTPWLALGLSLAGGGWIARGIGLGKLDCSTADVESSPSVAADCGDLATSKLNGVGVYNVSRDSF